MSSKTPYRYTASQEHQTATTTLLLQLWNKDNMPPLRKMGVGEPGLSENECSNVSPHKYPICNINMASSITVMLRQNVQYFIHSLPLTKMGAVSHGTPHEGMFPSCEKSAAPLIKQPKKRLQKLYNYLPSMNIF